MLSPCSENRLFGATVASLVLVACSLLATSQAGQAHNDRAYIGTLTCTVTDGERFVFGVTRDLSCIFEPFGGGGNMGYRGSVAQFGKNLGAAEGKVVLVWSVFSTYSTDQPVELSGSYRAITAGGAAVGSEAGLIGGLDERFTLRPMQTQANTNVNFATAIAAVELRRDLPRAGRMPSYAPAASKFITAR